MIDDIDREVPEVPGRDHPHAHAVFAAQNLRPICKLSRPTRSPSHEVDGSGGVGVPALVPGLVPQPGDKLAIYGSFGSAVDTVIFWCFRDATRLFGHLRDTRKLHAGMTGDQCLAVLKELHGGDYDTNIKPLVEKGIVSDGHSGWSMSVTINCVGVIAQAEWPEMPPATESL